MKFKEVLIESTQVKLDTKTKNAIKREFNNSKYFIFSEVEHKWDNNLEKLKNFIRKDLSGELLSSEEDKRELEQKLKNYTPLLTKLWDKSLFPNFDDYRKKAKSFVMYWDENRHGDDDGEGFRG